MKYFCSLFFLTHFALISGNDLVHEANQSYLEGEKAQQISVREEKFNKALEIYSRLEKENNPIRGNGKLYYDIGNSYFQLGKYPMALLYYYRAQQLMPRNDSLKYNLNVTLEKLGLSRQQQESSFDFFLIPFQLFSFPEKVRAFLFLLLVIFILGSINIWKPMSKIRMSLYFLGVIAALLFVSLIYDSYFSSIEGVVVQSSLLYRAPGEQFASVIADPVMAGNKVQIVEILENGYWLKVLLPTGELGYLNAKAVRII